jgi:hypothetical protein
LVTAPCLGLMQGAVETKLKDWWRIGDCSLPRIPTHGGWIGSLVTYFFRQWRLWEPELANEINQSAFLLGYFVLHRICREDCRGNGLQGGSPTKKIGVPFPFGFCSHLSDMPWRSLWE